MYGELDNLLSAETTMDSWYDEGFLIAQDIMNDFSRTDWQELSNAVLKKDLEWQKKLVYCLDNQMIEEELEVIDKMLYTEDDELLEMCIDVLRAFDNEMGHVYIKRRPYIMEYVEKRMETAGNVTKEVLRSFLEVFAG